MFYGPSKRGIEILGEFNYLHGVPVVRAVTQKTRTTKKIDRRMDAPRPLLLSVVREALRPDEDDVDS